MNPLRDSDRERLSKAMEHCYGQLSPFRASRRDLIADYAGSRYGQDILGGQRPEIYVNLIQIAAEAYSVSLGYNEPRFLVNTSRPEHWSFAKRFQTALDNYSRRIHLGDTMRAIIQDAVFMVGIGKTYLADSPE